MNTLIVLSGLAVLILLLEIINFRKGIVPMTILGLGGAIAATLCDQPIIKTELYNAIATNTFSQWFSILFIVLTMGIVALGNDFYKKSQHKLSDYISLKIFLLIGAVCMVSFEHLVMFFIGLEILSITLYVLAASNPQKIKSNEAGMKYFLMGSFASGFVLFGIALIYGATASFYLNEIVLVLTTPNYPSWLFIGFGMVVIGMLFKIAAFPFHFWAPDVYQGSPVLTTASMSTLAKVAAMATFFKLAFTFSEVMNTEVFKNLIYVLIICTMFVGNVVALKQTNIKRMLAYSGISHAGFMMFTLLSINTSANELLYYATAYATAGIAAFAVIMYVTENKKEEWILHFRGLGKKSPLMAFVLSLALLSMGGIPILSGFFAKFFLFKTALVNGYTTLVILGVINSIISIYYYFRVIMTMYTFKKDEAKKIELSSSIIYPIVAVVFIVINILIGLAPSYILNIF